MGLLRVSDRLPSPPRPLPRPAPLSLVARGGPAKSCGRLDLVRYLPELVARALALARNEADAEDLVQETCLRALASFAREDEALRDPGAWLAVVMRNAWANRLRAREVEKRAKARLGLDRADRILVGARVTRDQLVALLGRLPARAQRLVVACLLDGEGRGSVAREMGMTKWAIEASLYRSRQVLRREGIEG